jgi:DNA-binding Lrp family transcriptional regulator
MISALVLVNTALDSQEKVKERLKQIEGVEEAFALYGVYDLLIKIKALSIDSLKEITRFRIK